MRYRNAFKRHLSPAEVDVPDDLREGTRPGRVFPKKCFIEALAYADLHRAQSPLLCHGLVRTPVQPPFLHAWVEVSGVVFDGVAQMFLSADGYYRLMAAEAVRRYPPDEVAEQVLSTRHAGPWE